MSLAIKVCKKDSRRTIIRILGFSWTFSDAHWSLSDIFIEFRDYGQRLSVISTVTVDAVGQSSFGWLCSGHNTAEGKCLLEIMCLCTLKKVVGKFYVY